jgi:hypothetical protein
MHPDKKQLWFGLAFVNDWFFDRDSAKQDYRRFIEETETSREKGLWAMREHARLRLEELQSAPAL